MAHSCVVLCLLKAEFDRVRGKCCTTCTGRSRLSGQLSLGAGGGPGGAPPESPRRLSVSGRMPSGVMPMAIGMAGCFMGQLHNGGSGNWRTDIMTGICMPPTIFAPAFLLRSCTSCEASYSSTELCAPHAACSGAVIATLTVAYPECCVCAA
jgi:hypothetical protein